MSPKNIPTAYRWHSVMIDGKLVYGHTVPASALWAEVDRFHGRRPDAAIRVDGSHYWIMNSWFDHETGRCVRLEAGCSSSFTVAERAA